MHMTGATDDDGNPINDIPVLVGTTESILDTMARHIHSAASGYAAHEAIATNLWGHLNALGYTDGRFLVAGADAELLAGAPPDRPRVTEGITIDDVDNLPDRVVLAGDLPTTDQWPHHDLNLRPATRPDMDDADLAITNLPLCDARTLSHDSQIDITALHHSLIHQALSWLRPGGLLVALTHRQLLDGPDAQPRRSIAHQADLIAATRLPASALRAAPLQDSPVDLLLLRRREPGHQPDGINFIDLVPVHVPGAPDLLINNCYATARWALLGNLVPDPIDPDLTTVTPITGNFTDDLDMILAGHVREAIDFQLDAHQRPTPTDTPRPPSPRSPDRPPSPSRQTDPPSL